MFQATKNRHALRAVALGLFLALPAIQVANAATTDIADAPLFTSSVDLVKSNIMFILDDSGSMDWDYLPDDAQKSNQRRYGFYTAQCNGVAYNPAITYLVPVKADKTNYPNAVYTAAKSDVFTSTSTTNLSTRYYYQYTGTQPAMSYKYKANGDLDNLTTFYTECNSSEGSAPGRNVFTKVTVTSASTEAQNYANWYVYYRKRELMMKTSVGLAFKEVDDKYRIGFNVINNQSASGTTFLDIAPYDAGQKASFYTKLYATGSSGSTPLRGALSRAGQYFANKAPGQTSDPVQYSCQKNFAILSTDGYWNTGNESTSGTKYGPYKLDNSTKVGQQDGPGTPRPMLDGGEDKEITTKTWNVTSITAVATATPKTVTTAQTQTTTTTSTPNQRMTRNVYTYTSASPTLSNRSLTRCSSLSGGTCTITVRTSSDHGYSTGDTVTVAGASPSVYNGTFTITRIDNNDYSYEIDSRPSSNASPDGTSSLGSGSCSGGQGTLTTQLQAADRLSVSATTVTTKTTRNDFEISTVTTTSVTPYTQTISKVDGNIVSNTTTTGTPTSTSATVPTTTMGTPSTSTSSSTTATVDYTTWTNVGAATTSCATAAPTSPSTPVASGAPSSTTPVVVISGPNTSTPAPTYGTPSAATSGPVATSGAVTTTVANTSTGGMNDTLADVAKYYYDTDLRDSTLSNCTGALSVDVCQNNVAGGGRDVATHQHMTAFTLGLGNSGTLDYDSKYLTQRSGDYFDLTQGAKNWPNPDGGAANIDDLWHAAVNGRGQYFSASEPQALSLGLRDALDSIKAITGAASAAATSSLQPVQGNNDIFVGQFTSVKWTGDILSYKISPTDGSVSASPTWSAKSKLDAKVSSTRTIYYPKSGSLRAFSYANLTTDGMQANFDNFCSKAGAGATSAPTQCAGLNATDLAIANSGGNLVDYLRGTQTYSTYRSRDSVLGDIINASPLFVGKPMFNYTENSYGSFRSGSTRSDVIYAAANDGMLHAIDRATGEEKWAYIPSYVLPKMYKLADENYAGNHMFMVDGSPVMGDIYTATGWKTILVGGLNAGGRGYYALDVTNPETPKLLWEFSETDLGLTFGNPIITKKADGTWVVMFASGYNNVSPGDGNGYLYVLNANTGVQLHKLGTNVSSLPVGSTTTPSGLTMINAYIRSVDDNTTQVVYGGDLLGNVWRFDINSSVKPYLSAMRLAELKIGTTPQPITTRPSLAEVDYQGGKYQVLFIGTGKYLGPTDLANTNTQTIYALKDARLETGLGDVRAGTSLVAQVATASTSSTSGSIITGTANPVNWATKSGWYMDFISGGERVSVNPHLVLNTLYVGTNVPSVSACTVGGTSWLYKLDIGTGKAGAVSLGNVLVMGMATVQLGGNDGAGSVVTIVTRSDGTLQTVTGAQPTIAGVLRRSSWRVLK